MRTEQYDFTQEKLHTLTPSSRRVLENLPEPVTAKLYYSPVLGQRNPELRLMYDRVRLLLEQFARLQPENSAIRYIIRSRLTIWKTRRLRRDCSRCRWLTSTRTAFSGWF